MRSNDMRRRQLQPDAWRARVRRARSVRDSASRWRWSRLRPAIGPQRIAAIRLRVGPEPAGQPGLARYRLAVRHGLLRRATPSRVAPRHPGLLPQADELFVAEGG